IGGTDLINLAGFTSPPTGTGATGSARFEVEREETGAELFAAALSSRAGAEAGAEEASPWLTVGAASRTSPREGFFGSSTAGCALCCTGSEDGLATRGARSTDEVGAGADAG